MALELPLQPSDQSGLASPKTVMAAPEAASFPLPHEACGSTTGTIYVLRSLSSDPVVRQYADKLVKIGVTKGSVKQRIANAPKTATYLLAPVDILAEFELEGINPRKLEKLLHMFFRDARAEIAIKDRFGNDVKSREWFFVDVGAVKAALDHFTAGTMEDVRFDIDSGQVR